MFKKCSILIGGVFITLLTSVEPTAKKIIATSRDTFTCTR